MKYKVVGKRGDIPFTVSSEEIADAMENHCGSGEVRFLEYMYDETGRQVIGIKGLADLGHGYGFHNGWKEFSLKIGEIYSFTHDYTSIEGPSDWRDDSFTVTLQLVEVDEQS